MTFLSEDPTFLGGGLLLLMAGFLIAMRLTQQGRYLVWALSALGLAVVVVVVEHFWVTDNERIEQVVYDLKRAVAESDIEGVLSHLTPDVQFVQAGDSLPGEATRALIRTNLANTQFDLVRVSDLQASAGRQTRRGKAEFRVFAKGSMTTSFAKLTVGTASSTWSLGFRETAPGVWMVNRITPVSIPEGALAQPSSTESEDNITPRRGGSPEGALPGLDTRRRGPRLRGANPARLTKDRPDG